MPGESHGGPKDLESRVADLERRFDNFKTAALIVVGLVIALLIPPLRALLTVPLLVLVIVTLVLALIRLVMWFLARVDPSGPVVTSGGSEY
jgi:hypothetical protein